MPKPARPDPVFHTVDDLLAEVDRLRSGPVESGGRWTFAMILDHLVKSMRGDGLKPVPWPMSVIVRLVVNRMIKTGKYPSMTIKADKAIRPTDGVTMDAAYPAFISAAKGLKALPGPTARTPFGDMAKEDCGGTRCGRRRDCGGSSARLKRLSLSLRERAGVRAGAC